MERKTAERAAKWWADFLRNGAPMDNGDKSESGGFTMVLAILLQRQVQDKLTPASIDAFEQALVSGILGNPRCNYIGVDYHPDGTLQDAADAAGICVDGALPWKTSMWIRDDKITVAVGYGAPVEELEVSHA